MTEEEWLACADPEAMLRFLRGKASDRKLRLFACGCCRRIWQFVVDSRSVRAIETAEGLAGGLTAETGVSSIRDAAYSASIGWQQVQGSDASRAAAFVTLEPEAFNAAYYAWPAALCAETGYHGGHTDNINVDERITQTELLRDISGNPFRPIRVHPAWLTPTVTALATAAYEERILPSGELEPARLAVLADALEEAGCTNGDILTHLRSHGPHVRGCWALDLILGKQ